MCVFSSNVPHDVTIALMMHQGVSTLYGFLPSYVIVCILVTINDLKCCCSGSVQALANI